MARSQRTLRHQTRLADDSGFSLMETIISLGIISLAIGAISSMIIGVMAGQTNLRHRDQATSIAQSAMELFRAQELTTDGAGCVPLLNGRTASDVNASWVSAPDTVDLSTTDQASNPPACTGTGHVAMAYDEILGNFTFNVKTWVGTCQLLDDASNCVTSAAHPTTGPTLYRVVVAVEWPEKDCPNGQCIVTNSELLDPNTDPTFLGSGGSAVAAMPDSYCTTQDLPFLLNVVSNDTGTLGTDSVRVINPPTRGTLTTNLSSGVGGYIPDPSFTSGTDTLTYQLVDIRGRLSATTTVTISMQASCP